MKQWLQSIGRKIRTGMSRCYGADELSRFLLIVSTALVLLSILFPPLNLLALALLLWSVFRTCSGNIRKRQKERARYLQWTGKIRTFFRLRRQMFRERKTHRYFRCPACRAQLRVPKGKGTIVVTCTRCGHKITRKT